MKRIVVLAFVFLIGMAIFAQAKSGNKGVRLGMQLTPTVSWFTSDEVSYINPDGPAMGYSFGMVGDYFFADNYAFSTGLFMDALGGKVQYGNGMQLSTKNDGLVSMTGQATLRPTYLEVPIGFKFLTKEFWRTRFVGQCGFNEYVLLSAKVRHDGTHDKKDVTSEFSRLMTAYHFGFGVEYALGGEAFLTGGVLATIGINDVTRTKLNGVDPANKLNVVNFKVGIIF